jgi:peptide/nickel transport system ATP-binding protein
MSRPIDMAAVALGAGQPEDWPAPFGYSGDNAPPLVEIARDHRVRRAA